MAIYQLIACTIIANDILKASVYFGTEVFRTEILRCVTQFVKQKKCFLIVRFGVQMLCIDEHSFACRVKCSASGLIIRGHIKGYVQIKGAFFTIIIKEVLVIKD